MKAWKLLIIIAPLTFTSCSSVIHERFSLDGQPANSVSLDAKQRVIVVTDKAGEDGNRRAICAEPSPDAMVGIAASGAFEAAVKSEASAKLAGSLAESLAQLGERTPTIQLLRDGLYRACEAHLNGLLGTNEYKSILLGYDNFVVTLYAIEGLTQRRNPPVTLRVSTEVKGTGLEAKTTPINGGDVTLPIPSSGEPISKDIAEIVRDILQDYHKYQNEFIENFLKNSKNAPK